MTNNNYNTSQIQNSLFAALSLDENSFLSMCKDKESINFYLEEQLYNNKYKYNLTSNIEENREQNKADLEYHNYFKKSNRNNRDSALEDIEESDIYNKLGSLELNNEMNPLSLDNTKSNNALLISNLANVTNNMSLDNKESNYNVSKNIVSNIKISTNSIKINKINSLSNNPENTNYKNNMNSNNLNFLDQNKALNNKVTSTTLNITNPSNFNILKEKEIDQIDIGNAHNSKISKNNDNNIDIKNNPGSLLASNKIKTSIKNPNNKFMIKIDSNNLDNINNLEELTNNIENSKTELYMNTQVSPIMMHESVMNSVNLKRNQSSNTYLAKHTLLSNNNLIKAFNKNSSNNIMKYKLSNESIDIFKNNNSESEGTSMLLPTFLNIKPIRETEFKIIKNKALDTICKRCEVYKSNSQKSTYASFKVENCVNIDLLSNNKDLLLKQIDNYRIEKCFSEEIINYPISNTNHTNTTVNEDKNLSEVKANANNNELASCNNTNNSNNKDINTNIKDINQEDHITHSNLNCKEFKIEFEYRLKKLKQENLILIKDNKQVTRALQKLLNDNKNLFVELEILKKTNAKEKVFQSELEKENLDMKIKLNSINQEKNYINSFMLDTQKKFDYLNNTMHNYSTKNNNSSSSYLNPYYSNIAKRDLDDDSVIPKHSIIKRKEYSKDSSLKELSVAIKPIKNSLNTNNNRNDNNNKLLNIKQINTKDKIIMQNNINSNKANVNSLNIVETKPHYNFSNVSSNFYNNNNNDLQDSNSLNNLFFESNNTNSNSLNPFNLKYKNGNFQQYTKASKSISNNTYYNYADDNSMKISTSRSHFKTYINKPYESDDEIRQVLGKVNSASKKKIKKSNINNKNKTSTHSYVDFNKNLDRLDTCCNDIVESQEKNRLVTYDNKFCNSTVNFNKNNNKNNDNSDNTSRVVYKPKRLNQSFGVSSCKNRSSINIINNNVHRDFNHTKNNYSCIINKPNNTIEPNYNYSSNNNNDENQLYKYNFLNLFNSHSNTNNTINVTSKTNNNNINNINKDHCKNESHCTNKASYALNSNNFNSNNYNDITNSLSNSNNHSILENNLNNQNKSITRITLKLGKQQQGNNQTSLSTNFDNKSNIPTNTQNNTNNTINQYYNNANSINSINTPSQKYLENLSNIESNNITNTYKNNNSVNLDTKESKNYKNTTISASFKNNNTINTVNTNNTNRRVIKPNLNSISQNTNY